MTIIRTVDKKIKIIWVDARHLVSFEDDDAA
jgi:hypothetical protein